VIASLAYLSITPGCRPRLGGRSGGYYAQREAERRAQEEIDAFNSNPAFEMFDKYDPTDAGLVSAMKRSRASAKEFGARMTNPRAGEDSFSVMVCIGDDSVSKAYLEPFWLDRVTWDGERFHGALSGEPIYVRNVREGQMFSVTPEEICDWMYISGGRVMGAETTKYLRSKLGPDDRKQWDRFNKKYAGIRWD
jgi:uncharacterized protein YegJ (DUF2314 family)